MVDVFGEDGFFVADQAGLDLVEQVGFFADVGDGKRLDGAATEEASRVAAAGAAVGPEAFRFGVGAIGVEDGAVAADADDPGGEWVTVRRARCLPPPPRRFRNSPLEGEMMALRLMCVGLPESRV